MFITNLFLCIFAFSQWHPTHRHTPTHSHTATRVRSHIGSPFCDFLSCIIQTWAIGFRILYYQISESLDYYLLDYPSISYWLRLVSVFCSMQAKKEKIITNHFFLLARVESKITIKKNCIL